jgi:hypothetical protein
LTPTKIVHEVCVLLARPDAPPAPITAAPDQPLNYLGFYLPRFLS